MKTDVCVIGGGPAGLFSAAIAAKNGNKVIFNINYSINKTDNATQYNYPDASTSDEAISRLMFVYNNKAFSGNYNGVEFDLKFEKNNFKLKSIVKNIIFMKK